jgi:uncharacterized protein (TIGR00304 family)
MRSGRPFQSVRGPLRFVPLVVFVLGVALIANAVLRGQATLYLLLVIPVVSGGSAEFVAGTILVVLGIFGWFATGFVEVAEREAPDGDPARPSRLNRSGGVVLLGPIPIFFGDARPTTRGGWWAWVALGVVVSVAATVGFFLLANAR